MYRRAFLRSASAAFGAGAAGRASRPVAGHETPERSTPGPADRPPDRAGQSSSGPVGSEPRGTLSIPGAKEAVVGDRGRTVFVATTDGFATVDLRDPATPWLLTRERVLPDHPDGPLEDVWDLTVDGDRLLVVGPAHAGPALGAAVCYDIADPSTPRRVSVHETTYPIHNCALADGVAYLTANGATGNPLVTVDAATGDRLGEWSLFDRDDAWRDVPSDLRVLHDVWVQAGRAYLAHWDAGTWILDVADPTAPTVVSRVRGRSPGTLADVADPDREATELPGNDHTAVVDDAGDLLGVGLEAWDAAGTGPKDEDPAGGDGGGAVSSGTSGDGGDGSSDDAGGGSTGDAGVGSTGDTDGEPGEPGPILLYDVSDPAAPRLRGRIDPPPSPDPTRAGVWTTAHNFELVDGHCYSAWYRGGVRVHDVSDPAAPRELFHWRDAALSKFWTARRAVPGDTFVAASVAAPGVDDAGAGLFTFPDPAPAPEPTVAAGTGLGVLAGLAGVGAAALGAGLRDRAPWARNRRDE